MKRSPLKRKTPRRIARETEDDRRFKAWIHSRPCVGLRAFPSEFDPQGMEEVCGHAHLGQMQIEQSHIRNHTGLGLKPPDRQSLPMCASLHRQWEQRKGWFLGWTQEQRIAWAEKYVAEENEAFDRG